MPQWWVVCLCADWCGVCREYRATFDAVAAQHPDVRFLWVDVEDEDELVGDLDVETFPTILVGGEGRARFLAPVLPHGEALSRLLASLREPGASAAGAGAEAQEVFARIQALFQAAGDEGRTTARASP
ncbi:thioredoxin family protein [Xylophilus sp.]|uniref:thioredoxin family protein n=1 Tax=Xylophilus sp. TaxID=2653893 RepID=UPI0013B780B5|nr:thioredoxin family protein [Xylophilus sp.]KAF1046512.1 MAG: putative thioredoxin 2 [Xylophilus sp.]